MHWGAGHIFWPLFPVLWVIFLALLIGGLTSWWSRMRNRQMPFYAPDVPPGGPGVPPVQPSAMEILRQRYARGEIDATTFDQMRERLGDGDRPPYR